MHQGELYLNFLGAKVRPGGENTNGVEQRKLCWDRKWDLFISFSLL